MIDAFFVQRIRIVRRVARGCALALLSGSILTGCPSDKKRKTMYDSVDGGYILRDECNVPADLCWEDCFRREAGITCGSCCRDQRFLCDTQQKYSIDHCKTAQ